MTKEEVLKVHHYTMWNVIVNTIKETNSTVCIYDLKRAYCEAVGLRPIDFCFMCEFAYLMNCDESVACDHCPSVLQTCYNGKYDCLAGIYRVCSHTSDVHEQLVLSEVIRDSWKD